MLGAHKHSLVGLGLALLCEAEPGRAQLGVWSPLPQLWVLREPRNISDLQTRPLSSSTGLLCCEVQRRQSADLLALTLSFRNTKPPDLVSPHEASIALHCPGKSTPFPGLPRLLCSGPALSLGSLLHLTFWAS